MSNRYLRPAREMPQIYLYRVPINFCKQVSGLVLLVEQELGHNPFSGEQINWLLDGYDMTLLQGHKMAQYESVG